MSIVMNRKSVRDFKPNTVSETMIEALLKAGMQAPSANNQQPWNFIVVTEREKLDKLSEMSKGSWMLKSAPLAIIPVMLPGGKSPLMKEQDLSAATQNILVEAVDLGLGGVWIGTHPIKERVAFVKEIFDIPNDVTPFSIIALGIPTEKKDIIPRFDKTRVHYNEWKK